MNRKSIVILLLAFFSCVTIVFSQKAGADCKSKRGWCAATYQGLTIGQSTYADMVRVFGKPLSSSPSADQDKPENIIWHDYGKLKGNLSGNLAVETDKGTKKIVGISISPDDMTKEDAIKFFEHGFVEMGYEFCKGFEDDTVAPMYENQKATDIKYIEYQAKGIAIHLDYRGKVNSIYFVDEPIVLASKDDCKKEVISK